MGDASIASRYPATDHGLPARDGRAVPAHLIRDPETTQREVGMAADATALRLMAEGDVDATLRYAARAQTKLKPGPRAWLQADHIVSYKPQKP
jgi:predicted Zn-dependent protease